MKIHKPHKTQKHPIAIMFGFQHICCNLLDKWPFQTRSTAVETIFINMFVQCQIYKLKSLKHLWPDMKMKWNTCGYG